jgi:hypothetical protein
LRYDPTERASFPPELNLPAEVPLLDVVVVDVASGQIQEVGARVPSDVNPVSWTPDGRALLTYRYSMR